MIVKQNARAGVRWELRDDGKHEVIADGVVLVETSVESLAAEMYRDAVDERDPAKALRKAERAAFDVHHARWDGFGERSTKNRGRGGKGGRGGV